MLSLSNFSSNPKSIINAGTITFDDPRTKSHLLCPKNVNFLHSFAVSSKISSVFGSYASKKHGQGVVGSYASKKQGKGVIAELEIEKDDEEDVEFLDEDFDMDDVEYEDADDDEVIIPLRNMKKWLENKPPGFGEGKVYDTSIEDKLMEDIEQSRKAQLANINKLKNSPRETISKKEQAEKSKDRKDVQEGYRVRLVNLPKKKNIHKDLRLAFQGVSGIINIVPAVSGNKKTKDPVCKGFGFVDFKSENDADRFVQTFSGQSIVFGKVQKQVKCEILNSQLHKSASQLQPPSIDGNLVANEKYDSNAESSSYEYEDANEEHLHAVSGDDSHRERIQIVSQPETTYLGDVLEGGEGIATTTDEEIVPEKQENQLKTSGFQESDSDDDKEASEESSNCFPSLKQKKENGDISKKASPKRKTEKSTKLNIPGSANRLKIREKAMLTDVFSKYALNSASETSKER